MVMLLLSTLKEEILAGFNLADGRKSFFQREFNLADSWKIKFKREYNLAVAGYFWPKSLLNKQKTDLRPEIQRIWGMREIN